MESNGWQARRGGVLILLVVVLAACGVDRPLAERYDAGTWHSEAYRVESLTGGRGGARISFDLRLGHQDGRRLTVRGTVEIDPQATLIEGTWTERAASEIRSGVVSSAAVDFLGGQGGRPALGGRFTLSSAGEPVYRLDVPTAELAFPGAHPLD